MRHAVLELWDPFLLDIVVRGRIDDREADQKHIRVGVGERPQLVVVLLWEEQRLYSLGRGVQFGAVARFHRPQSFPCPGIWCFLILLEIKEPSVRRHLFVVCGDDKLLPFKMNFKKIFLTAVVR